MLAWDGRGNFSVLTPQESGIAISGEARAIALGDWRRDGWPAMVLTRVNENAMALAPRRTGTGHSFAVKLTGDIGNTDAIGARITVHCKNGAAQTVELYAGSGYLAQSEPLAFFGYTTNNEPQTIDVVWPDGTVTKHPFQANTPRIELKKTATM